MLHLHSTELCLQRLELRLMGVCNEFSLSLNDRCGLEWFSFVAIAMASTFNPLFPKRGVEWAATFTYCALYRNLMTSFT